MNPPNMNTANMNSPNMSPLAGPNTSDPFQLKHEVIMERITLLQELLTCNGKMYFWQYSFTGLIINTTATHMVLDTIFRNSGILDEAIHFGQKHHKPFISTVSPGMTWCVVYEYGPGAEPLYLHVLGPVFTTRISQESIDNYLKNPLIRAGWKPKFERYLKEIPVITATNFFNYTLMLQYCISNEHLKPSDITLFHSNLENQDFAASEKVNYAEFWTVENCALEFIRKGDIYYKSKLPSLSAIINKMYPSDDRDLPAVKQRSSIFAGLCIRAAIDGGLSPDTAYTRGNEYLKNITCSSTLTEVLSVMHGIYSDFIFLVHNHQDRAEYSSEIQTCMDYIELHIYEPLEISSLAARIGYADYYLSRKFKSETGTSINDYIKKTRIEQAAYLLVTTDLDIQTISDRLRFGDRSFFTRTFKKTTGETPAVFRANHTRK